MNQKLQNKICEHCKKPNSGPYKHLCTKCYNTLWKEQNKNYIKQYYHNYNQNQRENRADYERTYRQNHLTQIHNLELKYRNKTKLNPLKVCKNNIRKHINNSIKRNKWGIIKNKHTEEILGCSLNDFKSYIEHLFQPGMSWENYGEWHLDHIKPLATAKTEQEIYELCHYTNYQPLWAHDNILKGAKYEYKAE